MATHRPSDIVQLPATSSDDRSAVEGIVNEAVLMPGFRPVPRTGVIFVTTEAQRRGFTYGAPDWSNLGQGAPETGLLGVGEAHQSPPRLARVEFSVHELEYAPVDGLAELKEAVAALYNHRFRKGKRSQYTRDNVSIAAGGRVSLTRLAAALGKSNVGHFLPDYTAYEELLSAVQSFVPIPVMRKPELNYQFSNDNLRDEILGRGLSAFLLSNPSNPTGNLLAEQELADWVQTARELGCTLIFDEFYSHYIYDLPDRVAVSAAEFIEDVNTDPVVVVDGLTKNWRYPGFRVSWTLAPRSIIEAVASAGSFLDGGCPRPMQLAAKQLLTQEIADAEAHAIQIEFRKKRDFMHKALQECGIGLAVPTKGAFYCWGDVSGLRDDLNSGMKFFRKALEHKVIVVPGSFFDINPGGRRSGRPSRFENFVRFSFGPSIEELQRGVAGIQSMLSSPLTQL